MCEFLPSSSQRKERKKRSLRYDNANTRKNVMATVEFIYITSNTFILQSHFCTHVCVTHRISALYTAPAMTATVAATVTAVQLFYIQMHTYNTARSLCVLTNTQSNIALWISKKCAWKEIHQAFTQKYRMWECVQMWVCVAFKHREMFSRHFLHFHFDY